MWFRGMNQRSPELKPEDRAQLLAFTTLQATVPLNRWKTTAEPEPGSGWGGCWGSNKDFCIQSLGLNCFVCHAGTVCASLVGIQHRGCQIENTDPF